MTLPHRRPDTRECRASTFLIGMTISVAIVLGTPFLTRFVLWIGPLYEAYAKWAC